MKTALEELIEDIRKDCDMSIFNDKHIDKYLEKEKDQIKQHFEKGFLRSKTALLMNPKHYSNIYIESLKQ